MALIVDASVVLKLVIEEDGSKAAHDLLLARELAAPDLMFIECANVLGVKARRSEITRPQAKEAIAAICATPIRSIPVRDHVAAAQALALELDQTSYDCLYLAVAMAERDVLVSADARFVDAVAAHAVYSGSIQRLG